MKGRKRHIAVDTQGNVLAVVVHSADIQDRDGAKRVLTELKRLHPTVAKVWADGGYAGQLVGWADTEQGLDLEIVKRRRGSVGFEVLARRWVVERTFAWAGRCRRLAKDVEAYPETSATMFRLAMCRRMIRRLTQP